MKYNLTAVQEKIKDLPKEKDIFKLEKGLDIVIHEFLEEAQNHKGTICDIKDLDNQTIYRIHFINNVYKIEVITNSPKSTLLSGQMKTVKEAISLAINTINK